MISPRTTITALALLLGFAMPAHARMAAPIRLAAPLATPAQVVCGRDELLRPVNCHPVRRQATPTCQWINGQWLCNGVVPAPPPPPTCAWINGQWMCRGMPGGF
jgi:hypothetical protein